jgi:hypothetical protein
MKIGSIMYSLVGVGSTSVIGGTYLRLSESNALYPENFVTTITRPTFLLTAGITIVSALLVSGLIHILIRKFATPDNMSVSNDVSGFRVGKKTGTGT